MNQAPTIRHINPASLNKPKGFSHVVAVTGGTTIYVSGQVASDSAGNIVGLNDFRAQATQIFENIKAALAAAGASFNDVVKTNYYVLDIRNVDILREVRSAYLVDPPASTLLQVSKLAREEFLLEVEVVAVIA